MNTYEHAGNPVLIAGLLRSGTSLLYSLLNQHPQLALMYECDVWDFPPAFSKKRFRGEWLARQEFYNQVLSRHRLNWAGKLRGLEDIHSPDDLYRVVSDGKGAKLWGEKSPHYSARLVQLYEQYPNASFILIWRDPIEIYRSVRAAGLKTPFFRRPGMLHRTIYHKEKMVRETAELVRRGARVHQIRYNDLVDHTSDVCRDVCHFLGIEFDEKMAKLDAADLSAVYNQPQHDHLRGREIKRRQLNDRELLSPKVISRLERFRNRWERLSGHPLGGSSNGAAKPEPSLIERGYYQTVGATLFAGKSVKRLAFERLPLAWLRTYRLFKNWFHSLPPTQAANRERFMEHWPTLLASFAFLAGVCVVDRATGPEVSLAAFYALPPMALALIVNRGWGTVAALVASLAWSFFQVTRGDLTFSISVMLVWNSFMRFVVLEIIVLLLDRIRQDMHARAGKS